MELNQFVKSKAGRQAQLARLLGVSCVTVSLWASGRRRVPAERCPAIEQATDGAVSCEEMRPDVNWAVVRGGEDAVHRSSQIQTV